MDYALHRACESEQQLIKQRQIEQPLPENERQFRTLANSIPQLAWMADREGYIFWYNDRWFDYTGTTFEEMKGWGWQKVHHPDQLSRVVESIKLAFGTGQSWEDTFPLRGKNGEYRWFLSRALPIKDAQGQVVRYFGTNTDITEQRQLEQTLRAGRDASEQKVSERTAELSHTNEILRSIMSNMGDAVVVARGADAAGGRRVPAHAGRQQQRLVPGQRDELGGLDAGAEERRLSAVRARIHPVAAAAPGVAAALLFPRRRAGGGKRGPAARELQQQRTARAFGRFEHPFCPRQMRGKPLDRRLQGG